MDLVDYNNISPALRFGILIKNVHSSAARSGNNAARIHHNLVEQPIGPAMYLGGTEGALQISDNLFNTGISRRTEDVSGSVVSIISLSSNSQTQFLCNKVRLDINLESISSLFIETPGDLEFTSNQSDVASNLNPNFSYNTSLYAGTLRAHSNRLTDPLVQVEDFFSLEAYADSMNTVIGNQVDHCISVEVGYGGQIIEEYNISLFEKDDPYCGTGSNTGRSDKSNYG